MPALKINDGVLETLATMQERYDKLNELIMSGGGRMRDMKEMSWLTQIVNLKTKYEKAKETQKVLEEFVKNEEDEELKNIAKEDLEQATKECAYCEHQIMNLLLGRDEEDDKNVVLEVRPGTGGDEASLFAYEIFEMYENYANLKGWRFERVSVMFNEVGGLREGIAIIRGESAFSTMKFESGTHRVQRVPETESQGRIHTSTCVVLCLPEAEEVDIKIEKKDLKIETFRASGNGGQAVNKTDSAVRITHIPTGISVSVQDERSQHANKDKAMTILRARVYEHEKSKVDAQREELRNSLLSRGLRSEKIRTYNFAQDRITGKQKMMNRY